MTDTATRLSISAMELFRRYNLPVGSITITEITPTLTTQVTIEVGGEDSPEPDQTHPERMN